MTVVVGFTSSFSSVLIADSRLTWQDQQDESKRFVRDVCQKIIPLGNVGALGFAGDVRTAYAVLRLVTGTFNHRGLGWLKDESEIRSLMGVALSKLQQDFRYAKFIVTFLDQEHFVRPETPGAMVISFSTLGEYSQTYLGALAIGSGSDVYGELQRELVPILNMGAGGEPSISTPIAHRALFLAEITARYAKSHKIDTVGGLFQICCVTREGVIAIPYERWVDVSGTHGTYVQMDIDTEGRWIQKHPASGVSVKLGLPYKDEFTLEDGHLNLAFDLAERLSPDSLGLIPRSNPLLLFKPINDEWIFRTPASTG